MSEDSSTTMSHFIGSIALIRDADNEQSRWLVRLGTNENHAAFVQAERLEQESYRDALKREIAWELELDARKDFIISSVPRIHFQSPLADIGDAEKNRPPDLTACNSLPEKGVDWVIAQFFVVDLFGRVSREKVAANSRNQWWTPEEILAGISDAGTRFHSLQHQLVLQTEVITTFGT